MGSSEAPVAQVDRVAARRIKVDLDPVVLARYVGRYQLAPDQVFDISLAGDQLRVRLGDQPQFPLYAESESKFFLEVVDAQITFILDASGRPSALVLHQGGKDQEAARLR